jgi:tetratricopeptide (TPR) repeat protein
MNFFHLYYLPVIPLGRRQRTHKYCSKCNMTQQIDTDAFDALIHELKENAANAVLAIQEGEETVELEGAPPTDALEMLEGAIDWFYSSNDHDFNQGILDQLNHPKCRYAEAMLRAYSNTMAGKLDHAIDDYAAAIQASPKRHVPYVRQANLMIENRKVDQAIAVYQAGAKLAEGLPDELAIHIFLAHHLMNRKRFDEAHKVHCRIVELHPPMMNDRQFAKGFAKAKKKSGND